MDEQPWAPFSEVVADVTKVPLDEVRKILTEHRERSNALLTDKISEVLERVTEAKTQMDVLEGQVSEIKDLLDRSPKHRRTSALPWIWIAVLALGDAYFIAERLIGR